MTCPWGERWNSNVVLAFARGSPPVQIWQTGTGWYSFHIQLLWSRLSFSRFTYWLLFNTFIIGCLASQGVRPAAWVLIRASPSHCASISETILHPLFPMETMSWFIGSQGMKCIHVRIIFVLSSCTFQEKLSANFPSPKVRCVYISVNSLAVWLFDSSRIPIRSVIFHPQNPLLFICTGLHVQIYDLQRQVLLRKLSTGTRRLSCMAIHSGGFLWILRKQKSQFSPEAMPCARTGENIIVGSEDGKLSW